MCFLELPAVPQEQLLDKCELERLFPRVCQHVPPVWVSSYARVATGCLKKNFLLSKLAAIGCNCMTSFHLAKLCSDPLPCWISAFTSLTKFVDNWFEKNSYKNWCNWKVKVITMSSCHNRRLCSHVKRFTPCRSYGEKQTWDGAGYVVSMKEILT